MHPAQVRMLKLIDSWNKLCEEGALEDIGGLGIEFWVSLIIPKE